MISAAIILSIVVTVSLWTVFLSNKHLESVFSPFFWYLLFHTFVFVIRPIALSATENSPVWDYMLLTPTDALISETFLVASFGLIAYAIGHLLAISYPTRRLQPLEMPSNSAIKFTWVTLGALAVYSAIFASSNNTSDNVNIITERVNGVSVNVNTNGYLLDAQFLFLGLCTLLATKGNFSFLSLSPALLFFAHRAYIGWGRWSIALTAIALYFSWLNSKNRRWPTKSALLFAVPIFLLFSILGDDRDAIKNLVLGKAETSLNTSDSALSSLEGMDFANFEYLAYIIHHVPESSKTYTYGLQHLQVFTEPIPRVLWSGKPAGPPFSSFNLSDFGNFLGMTPSLVGDGWQSGGVLGMLITVVIAAFFLGRLYVTFLANPNNRQFALSYLVFSALYVQFFRDGSLVSVAKAAGFGILPIYFSYLANAHLNRSNNGI